MAHHIHLSQPALWPTFYNYNRLVPHSIPQSKHNGLMLLPSKLAMNFGSESASMSR